MIGDIIMYDNEIEYEKISRKIKRRYLPTVVAIVVLLIASWAIMQYKMFQDKYYLKTIESENDESVIQSNERIYLNGMNQIIMQYNKEYRKEFLVFEILENIFFISIIAIIIIQNLYVFRTADIFLRKACKEKCKENENFIKLFRTLSGGLFLVEEKSLQIIHMNEDAERISKSIGNSYQGKNITELVQWEAQDNISIIDKIKTEDKVTNLEVMIRENGEKMYSYLLSSVKGNYQENNVILISLFDTTLQKQAEETLRKLAIKDELTGLYNRHFMDAIIEEEMERSVRYNYPISVAILDLDYFKRINDNWGHPVGDIILKETAEMISKNIRKSDFLIRLGGEEFLLIMPHTYVEEAIIVAEKIRKEIEAYTNPIVGKYTASLGVTQRISKESFHTIYERADAAMYRAKNEGRNRVVSFKSQADMPIASVYLEWKMEWNSGNKEVDEQHMELLSFANSLMYISLSNKDKEKAKQLVELLEQKIVHHFEYEDEVLSQIAFPDYQNHLQIHQNLIKKFGNLKNSYQKGEVKPSLFFMFIVDEVIMDHLIETDTKFFPYISQ